MLAEIQQDYAEDLTLAAPANAIDERVVRVRLHGRRNGPLVIVAGGISAHRAVAGEGGWWADIVREAGAIDLDRFCVLGFDFAPIADRTAQVTPDAQAALLEGALEALGVARVRAFVGASYGAMVGLALAARAPGRVERVVAISAAHRPAALGRAWRGVQRRIVREAIARGDAASGLALARQLAMITYRSAEEFETRFGGWLDESGDSDLDRYLIARGEAYAQTVAARRWLALSESIDRHAVDPARVDAAVTLVACPTDQLAPLAEIEALGRLLPRLEQLHVLPSLYGHDAFLKEPDQLFPILRKALGND